jgi:hypothetical protein
LASMDDSCTARGLRTVLGIPKSENRKAVLYDTPITWASTQAVAKQGKLFLKLSQSESKFRRNLLQDVVAGRADNTPLGQFGRNAAEALGKVGIGLSSALTQKVAPFKRRKLGKAMISQLRGDQTQALLDGTMSLSVGSRPDKIPGMSDLSMLAATATVTKVAGRMVYDEHSKLVKNIRNDQHRKAVRKIRTGYSNSKRSIAKHTISVRGVIPYDMTCQCGYPIQDHHHLVHYCPYTQSVRDKVLHVMDSTAGRNPVVAHALSRMSPMVALNASLGGSVIGDLYEKNVGSVIMAASAPTWAKGFKHLLKD